MAKGTGSATVTFPVSAQAGKPVVGSSIASTVVTGLVDFLATDNVSVWIMGSDSTADHNAYEHAIAPIECSMSNPVSGVGFTIDLTSNIRLDGDFKVRFVWAT